MLTASAASPAVAQLLGHAAAEEGAPVEDVASGGPRGAALAASVLPLVLAGILTGVLATCWRPAALARAALLWRLGARRPRRDRDRPAVARRGRGRLGRQRRRAEPHGAAIASVIAGLKALLGERGVALGALTMILVGNPFSGVGSARSCCREPVGGLGQAAAARRRRQPPAQHGLLRRRRRGRPRRGARSRGPSPASRCCSRRGRAPAGRAASQRRRAGCLTAPSRPRLSGGGTRSARSTTRATSSREDTPSLWNRLRRWLHGLGAQEELGRDLGVGPPVDDEPRHLQLALGQRLDAALARAGRVRRRGRRAELAAAPARRRRAAAVAPHASNTRRPPRAARRRGRRRPAARAPGPARHAAAASTGAPAACGRVSVRGGRGRSAAASLAGGQRDGGLGAGGERELIGPDVASAKPRAARAGGAPSSPAASRQRVRISRPAARAPPGTPAGVAARGRAATPARRARIARPGAAPPRARSPTRRGVTPLSAAISSLSSIAPSAPASPARSRPASG